MTTQDHISLADTIERAKGTAASSHLHIAVVEELYTDEPDNRFNYCPTTGLSTLYRPSWVALLGIAYPNGQYFDALAIVDELERSAR